MNIDLRLGDCLDLMKDIPDQSVDLVFTSPPYNLGNSHHTGNNRHKAYDDNMPEEQYQDWQISVLAQCHRVLRETGSLIYNHKNRIKNGIQITPYQWLLKTDFVMKQEIVWFNRSQNFDKIRFYPMTERIYWMAKSPKTKLFNAINHHDVFSREEWKPVGTKQEHTRAFPLEMCIDIMRCFGDARDVLDPFLGSGTTLLACKSLGINGIGIEKDPRYFEIARQRIS